MLALPQPSTRSLQHVYQTRLGQFLQDREFVPEVKECLFPLVSAAISIYYKVNSNMRPTPSKSHYTFNIRDLAQVSAFAFVLSLFLGCVSSKHWRWLTCFSEMSLSIRPVFPIIPMFCVQVVTGLLQAEEDVILSMNHCAQLFAHEATRVFHDRLVSDADRTAFYRLLVGTCQEYFKVSSKILKCKRRSGSFLGR